MLSQSDCGLESNAATYCPEDNKLRLYVGRVSRESYEHLRKCGYQSTPKQDCDFVAAWSIDAEDAAYELLPDDRDIEDEDYSPQERAADRAERFTGYREKRADESEQLADRYDSQPSVFGYQNQQKAEHAASRRDRVRDKSLCQWSKAEYWQQRTSGVIRNALHKSSAAVRRDRILRLEAEQRKYLSYVQANIDLFNKWTNISNEPSEEIAYKKAVTLANHHCHGCDYQHPRRERKSSLWNLLADENDKITGKEAAALWLSRYPAEGPAAPGSNSDRWTQHYANRLAYENAMLENEGGKASEVEMEIGGFVGRYQIHKINRSTVTKRVVSVAIMAEEKYYRGEPVLREDGTYGKPLALVTLNIERFGNDIYRAPTDEERAAFKEKLAAQKKAAKANKPDAVSLINPTMADAQQLQDLLNSAAAAKHGNKAKPSELYVTTQEDYAARSKGTYNSCETRILHSCGRLSLRDSNMWTQERADYRKSLGKPLCKVRIRSSGDWYSPERIVVLSDKPQKALPFDQLVTQQEEVMA